MNYRYKVRYRATENVLFSLQNEKIEVILLVILLFGGITKGKLLQSASLTSHEVHLVRCLTNISDRYFATGRYLLIASPATYRDVQQELIAEIHRISVWPVLVAVGGNISLPETTDLIYRDGSYIILIPDGNYDSFLIEMYGLILGGGKMKRFWNSESRFVVAGANTYSISQQTDIFDYFSKMRIYNCIIVSQMHYVMDEKYSRPTNGNDVDTGIKFGVYTWFPYQSSDRCTEVNDITLLDSWVISAQGHFTKNTDLFPRKVSKSFKGCPMKAVVRDCYGHFTALYVKHTCSNGSVVTYVQGLEMDLLRVVLQQMNMTFIHVPTPEGFEVEKGLISNLVMSMFEKNASMALGDVGTHSLLLSFFDSTNPYYTTKVRWYVPCSVKYPRWSSIFRILSAELWVFLILSIVIAAISTTLVARYSCTSEWQVYKTLTSSLTNVWSVILGVSVSTMPRAPSLRSLFFAWVCFSVAFTTVFQAFLTTFLIDSGYKTPIRNTDEMFASGIKLAYPPEYDYIFRSVNDTETLKVHRSRVNCPSSEICLNWAKYQKNVSNLLSDILFEMNYASGDLIGENSKPLLCKLEDGVVLNFGHSMIMFHGDPLMRRVTEIIDSVVEAGIYNYWVSQFLNNYKLLSRKIALVHPLDEYYSFNLYHIQPAFYLLLMGSCLSVFCFMVEMFYNRLLCKRM